MKKKFLFTIAVLTAMFAHAKDHTIVVRTDQVLPKGHTIVKVDQTGNGDIITITPAKDATAITVTIKAESGEVIAEGDVPATTEGVYEVTTPETTEGTIVEVSDNNGVVYADID